MDAKARRNARTRLLKYLKRGGAILDEGIGWCRADRGGGAWAPEAAQRLIAKGWRSQGSRYELVESVAKPGLWVGKEIVERALAE